MDGHVVNGPRGNAGAVGSMLIKAGPRTATQLLEHASGWQLEQAMLQAGHDPLLVQSNDIVQARYAPLVKQWLTQASHALAMSIISAEALLDIDAIVIDGSLSPELLQALREQTTKTLSQLRTDGIFTPTLVAGQVGSHARALGAALLPLHAQFFPDKHIFLKENVAL
jgi:predicted NBD/HSP70 family sugar kinase